MKDKLTIQQLADQLGVKVWKLPILAIVTVKDGDAMVDVNVQAALRQCVDYETTLQAVADRARKGVPLSFIVRNLPTILRLYMARWIDILTPWFITHWRLIPLMMRLWLIQTVEGFGVNARFLKRVDFTWRNARGREVLMQHEEIGELSNGYRISACTDGAGAQLIVKGEGIHLLSQPFATHEKACRAGADIIFADDVGIYEHWTDMENGRLGAQLYAAFGGMFQ